MNLFKAGIVGCGNMGGRYDERDKDDNVYTHAGMYSRIDEFDLVCAADNNERRLQKFGQFWKVPHLYKDYRKMFKNERLDIVSIATPDESHHKIILDAVEFLSPRIIFTEKPLATNLKSAIETYEACRKRNINLVVDYVRRWDKHHQFIKDFFHKESLGSIQTVVGYYVRGLNHNGCQMINLIQFLFGKITNVQVLGDINLGSLNGDPSLNLYCSLEDGTPVYIMSLDQKGYGFSLYEMDVFGEEGRLRLLNGGQKMELYRTVPDLQFPNFKNLRRTNLPLKKNTYGSAMIRAGEQFVCFLNNKTDFLHNTALDAIDDLYVIEAALDSASNKNSRTPVKDSCK